MANRTNYYADGKTVYQADDFRAPWAAIMTDGVLNGYAVSADSPADLAISVSAGVANHAGYISRDDAPTPVEILANTSGYNRIDLIVLDFDETNCVTTPKDIQGIPSSSPAAPAAASNQIVLAQIVVGNNASVIDSNVITDARKYASPTLDHGTRITQLWSGFQTTAGTITLSESINNFKIIVLEMAVNNYLQGINENIYFPTALYGSAQLPYCNEWGGNVYLVCTISGTEINITDVSKLGTAGLSKVYGLK